VRRMRAFLSRESGKPEFVNPDTKYLSLPGHECRCYRCLRMRGVTVIGGHAKADNSLTTEIYVPTQLNDVALAVTVDIPELLVELPMPPRNRAERRARRGR
jgi:hypothetical protein